MTCCRLDREDVGDAEGRAVLVAIAVMAHVQTIIGLTSVSCSATEGISLRGLYQTA